MNYLDDLRDVKFNLFEWLPFVKLLKNEHFSGYEKGDVETIMEEALKVAQEVLAPCNEEGDKVGAQLVDGKVVLPKGYHSAYATLCEAGWLGTTADQEWGGMGLPECVGTAVMEFFLGANVALTLSVMLGRGTSHLIESFGSEGLKKTFCEKMNKGEWGGTMCLTEAGAGSDVGASKTKAVKVRDGVYKISGEKIFITNGDNDLSKNMIHAVLARLPDAPAGTKGLSLFIVPKIRVNADGSLGQPNDVAVGSIEHKLGIHGSPTCVMVFGANDGCEGYLLGKENEGMALMFLMMNAARYEVGLQGLAIASTAFRHAVEYSKQRLQGKHFKDRTPDGPQVPIVEHPDVKRMLLTQMGYAHAMRALLYHTAYNLDMAKVSEGEEKKKYQGVVEVLTPICKAWCTDWGVKMVDMSLQCFGGYGYTAEYPAEQYLRDARIAPIYEGTNGIQALDLCFRKFKINGDSVQALMMKAGEIAQEYATDMDLGASGMHLGAAVKELGGILKNLGGRMDAPLVMLPNAPLILDMMGHVISGAFLLEQAGIAQKRLKAILREKKVDPSEKKAYFAFLNENSEAKFYHNKIQAAIHFMHYGVPQVHASAAAVKSGVPTAYDVAF